MNTKPDLLYVSPVRPALTGNGLAMRAGTVLEALAEHYRVWLHVVPLYPAPDDRLAPSLAGACVEVEEGLERPFPGRRFDVVHVFRLAAVPYARSCQARERHVDLDDVETGTLGRIAALARSNGDVELAEHTEQEALRYEPLEREVLAWDRVYVCSDADRTRLERRATAEVLVLRNAVRLSAAERPSRDAAGFTFLFVGSLGYYPNEDAMVYFCDAILPELRSLAPSPFRVVVAGAGAGRALDRLAGQPEVRLVGAVPDLSPWYRQADAAIVPLRAGGGTRIKILEAFAYRCPVVATPIGCEGLETRDGEHLLIAEPPAAFARQCARLMADEALARRLTERAHELLLARHTLASAVLAVAPAAARPRSAAPATARPRRPS